MTATNKISILVLDFNRPEEGRNLLLSLQKFAKHDKEIVYLCNGGESDYAYKFYQEGLIDTLIIKKHGDGGGFGQTDLWRYCKTEYAFFVQVDHVLQREINEKTIEYFINLLNQGFKCIDLNGDQSGKGAWTDRAHFMKTEFFNSLGPFPNFGPGLDNGKWNEQHLQEKFRDNNYRIAHITPIFFGDTGKYSERQAGKNGEGILIHRTDNKQMWVVKPILEKCSVYPPLSDPEFEDMISGNWPKWGKDVVGRVPEAWKNNVFEFWR